jgi:pimeloyl-ACP methyl ester carboxylesterase
MLAKTTLAPLAPYQLLTRRSLGALAAATALAIRLGRPARAQDATPTTQSSTAHVNGIDLSYEEQGSGPPLLLIPGLAATASYWASLAPALAPHFHLIALDNRGAGRSSAPPGPYTTRVLADDAAALLDHLGIERAHILGFSLGSLIAQELTLAHPERVDRLVLLGSTAQPNHATFDPWVDLFVQAYERELDFNGFSLWLMAWLFTPTFMEQPDVVAATIPALASALASSSAQGVAAQAAAAKGHDTLNRLGNVAAPTLVLVGEADIVFPVIYSRALADAIPEAKLQVLPSGGHAVSLEDPESTATALLQFLTT